MKIKMGKNEKEYDVTVRLVIFVVLFLAAALHLSKTSTDVPQQSKKSGSVQSALVKPSEIRMEMLCEPKTREEKEKLKEEIQDYQNSPKFTQKIAECKGEYKVAPHHKAIINHLKDKVLKPGWSVLDLGAAAGGMLRMVMDAYRDLKRLKKNRGKFQGVELVPGWVEFASEYFSDKERWGEVGFVQGDITDFELPDKNATFDFVMLNDVMEHLQKNRYGCFFEKLKTVTHKGSVVYMHTPTPVAQIHDSNQYFENVLPHHVVVMGMAQAGFELLNFELDSETVCLKEYWNKESNLPRQANKANCYFQGFVKYYHATFLRVKDERVFNLS